ncbi:MAG: 4-hydroxy-tetrahydrodipicolinate reductase [Gammaproteobacteria bacterium]|nr:4-hydroxy-tetrahydrodipicolinate reductase [Gammaproteobacteria bacterium]
MTSIIINAATGRMGKELLTSAVSDAGCVVAAAMARENHPLIGSDIGYLIGANPQGKLLIYDYAEAFQAGEVIIDFSLPAHSMATLEQAVKAQRPMVIGTTGFSDQQLTQIHEAAQTIPIMLSANYSLGVNALLALARQTTQLLGTQSDIEIFEAHHKHKIDAPSGTALAIGEAIAETQGKKLNDIAQYERSGKREAGEIGFSVMRAGEIIGTHEVIFALNGELLTLKHEAQSRQCFAQGAIEAAKWLVKQPAGLYDMQKLLQKRAQN